ncbi:GTPase-activating Rap/Ran-GAP domain-like protein 3 isoform X2 [Octopus sinensis]|uniref:GTPase-activating Rap/Ran-GAP domain-like protein 3 n=1 Tax=Octopus sinensis TaxID=2607531 RepID=A0A7E6FPA4_9MOLL|nr:GTPase-activating Rap/Ran-GAP domain-like protein 3 isoform X2 [Octopus sinensis]
MDKLREKLQLPKTQSCHEVGSLNDFVRDSMYLAWPVASIAADGRRSPRRLLPRQQEAIDEEAEEDRINRERQAECRRRAMQGRASIDSTSWHMLRSVSEERRQSSGSYLSPTTNAIQLGLKKEEVRIRSRAELLEMREQWRSSPASDLAARRGVFSRRHYGSVELLTSCDAEGSNQSVGRFRVETGERDTDENHLQIPSPLNSPIHLENPESQTRWYFRYFLGKLHQNYVGADAEKEPFVLSVVVTDANNLNVPQYRTILWRKTGAQRICLSFNPNKPQTVKGILNYYGMEKIERGPKEVFDTEIQKELLVLEEQEGSVNFKFGVLFAKDGQTSDDDMYCNEEGNSDFQKFIDLLGDRVKLKDWDRFKGGLDVKTDSTGTESRYVIYEGHEIMFHVSTLLPYSPDNRQQVERKRHIGNDIVNIVYFDCDFEKPPVFKPNMMKTHFTHIYAVVMYNKEQDAFKLSVFSEESVPLFGPVLPSPPIFTNHKEFRDFLLVKLINGEKAAVNNRLFAQKRERTLDMLIRNIYQEYMPELSKNNILYRRAFSDVIGDGHGSRRKERARQAEFVRIGQTLKLKTILKGDAPTSQINTDILKREPWEPQIYYSEFPHHITCADSWGDKLMVATEIGLMVLEEGVSPRLVLDKSISAKQINIIEQHGLLLIRADKGKDGKVYVFRLSDFEGVENEFVVKSKSDCKDNRLEGTKGCHLYAISRQCEYPLRLAVAVSRKIVLYSWKHLVTFTSWCPKIEFEPVDRFSFVQEIHTAEVPSILTLVDGKDDNYICVGYKNQFTVINEKTGDCHPLYHVEGNRVSLVAALDIYEDDEPELLLCYNHISHFQKLREETVQDMYFQWNSEPQTVVCAFPYVMAFTQESIEIRLIINGNLVHTMSMPDLMLVASKSDIYFISSAYSGISERKKEDTSLSPPPSPSGHFLGHRSPIHGGAFHFPVPHAKNQFSTNIYKIPLMYLTGQMASERTGNTAACNHNTLLAPVSSELQKSPSLKRSPLIHTKKNQTTALTVEKDNKDRHDSSGSDSGIMIMKLGETPPVSPFSKGSMEFDEVL